MRFIEFRKKFPHFQFRSLFHGDKGYDITFSEEELLQELESQSKSDRFLGRFSHDEVSKALDKYGIWKSLEEKGYPHPRLIIRSLDPFRQSVKILTSGTVLETEDSLLSELRVYSGRLHPIAAEAEHSLEMDALVIDWLQFQNPKASFTDDRPPLPGQRYPGLGILRSSLRAILDLATQIEKDAIVTTPEYYHNAVLYHPNFMFFSPEFEGLFRALQRFLSDRSLAEASRAVTDDKVFRTDNNHQVHWTSHEQIHAIAPGIRRYFASGKYRTRVEEAERRVRLATGLP